MSEPPSDHSKVILSLLQTEIEQEKKSGSEQEDICSSILEHAKNLISIETSNEKTANVANVASLQSLFLKKDLRLNLIKPTANAEVAIIDQLKGKK